MSSDNRAARRRAARGPERTPVVIAGDGIVATSLGDRYEARPSRDLPPKVPGEHRWICAASWVLPDSMVEHAGDEDVVKLLDHENLMSLSIGCWDCERPLGKIEYGSRCPAPGS